MELIRNFWDTKSIRDFENYLNTLSRPEKVEWTKNISCTNLKLFAIPNPNLKKIAKEIHKGNYISFWDNCNFSTYEMTLIYGYLLNFEKNFQTLQMYLKKYLPHVDCWASCDILKFNNKLPQEELFNLAISYTHSKETFTRRIGLKIMFAYTNNSAYLEKIFNVLNSFEYEQEYYVNMIVSWLFCEMFIKHKSETYKFLKTHKLNTFCINKGIQKCRDSFRVSPEDKQILLKYKK